MQVHQYLLMLVWLACCRAAFEDEMQSFEDDCLGEDKFACYKGGCVLQTQYCDGQIDCEDGTDENFCLNENPVPEFCNQTNQYLCEDKRKCLPHDWVCNNVADCDDSSDEANCTSTSLSNKVGQCKGYSCDGGKCISNLWVCDGVYDCKDKTDEYADDVCRHSLLTHKMRNDDFCHEMIGTRNRNYKCLDSSFCLPNTMMCDGMPDCKDGSDEGPFCSNWQSMCTDSTCPGNITTCYPERTGPICICHLSTSTNYNNVTRVCEDVDECLMERPQCSQKCINGQNNFRCQCEAGYSEDQYGYLCYAMGPEAMLFFSTHSEIKYLTIKTKQLVTIATAKEAHGVSFDGRNVYWVETARGHQSIVRAQLNDVHNTKEVLVALGLEEPGDIAVDWMGGHIYFSDSERGSIYVCHYDGSKCTTIKTNTQHPKFVTLDPKNGKMYWADLHSSPVIMTSRMDGSKPETLVDNLGSYATGLAIDVPNDRLYYVDKTIKVIMLSGKKIYSLFDEPFHHPYSIAVFENTVFWSDWTSNTIQMTDKLHGKTQNRNILLTVGTPVIDMHMYHPVLMNKTSHPCNDHPCSHFCLITSNTTYSCACPDDMDNVNGSCRVKPDYRPLYLVVGGGSLFTRFRYDMLGNPETHATHFDIGRVQAMAYDSARDNLYIFDGQRRTLNYVNMSEFTIGLTYTLVHTGFKSVVDMDYDYVTDNLYVLDAGHRVVEVISMSTHRRALVHKFDTGEVPIAIAVMPDYGKMLLALVETDEGTSLHIDTIGMDGEGRHSILKSNLLGPHIRLQYVQSMDSVYFSDEGSGLIDYIHPEGSGRQTFREVSTTVKSLAIAENYVFWTERASSKLFWSDIHEVSPKIRRIEFSMFPNKTQLLVLATKPRTSSTDSAKGHPCRTKYPCSHICLQRPVKSHIPPEMSYKCLCPTGMVMIDGKCSQLAQCGAHELLCHQSNVCIDKPKRCDGTKDCTHGEDEEGCEALIKVHFPECLSYEILCNGECVDKNMPSDCSDREKSNTVTPTEEAFHCNENQFHCERTTLCIDISQVCDGERDCPSGNDELPDICDLRACSESEFMCTSGACLQKLWRCDGVLDCSDGSDEVDCGNQSCPEAYFQCDNKNCIEMSKRCDGHHDCFDFSDEQDCDEPVFFDTTEPPSQCASWEYTCELNHTICLPLSARCNMRVDCPGSTDETGCDYHCAPLGMFSCKQQLLCLPQNKVCNGKIECDDGSDETPEACASVNRTSHYYPAIFRPASECHNGFLCKNGQCVEWKEVCDNKYNCLDGSDENGLCATACQKHPCEYSCKSSPYGPHCFCPPGYRANSDQTTCRDVDECARDACSQDCYNVQGSFICSCHHGYALRSDRRSCKAIGGSMSILYATGSSVRSISAERIDERQFSDPQIGLINDLDTNLKLNKIYVSSSDGKLIEISGSLTSLVIANVGQPTKIAVDWLTDNIYFVDSSPQLSCIRVCNLVNKRCAKLQTLPPDSKVTTLIVEPTSRRMFYCMLRGENWAIWTSSLSGQDVMKLDSAPCTGLATNPFLRTLYVATSNPGLVYSIDFKGNNRKIIISENHHLQNQNGLAFFEDHVYYQAANRSRIARCLIYEAKTCETYADLEGLPSAFVIKHPSYQRDDLRNDCAAIACKHVCALDEKGPMCLCDDGSVTRDGNCELGERNKLPLFNGVLRQEYSHAHSVSFTVVTIVLILFVIYLCLFLYYQFVYKPRKTRASRYAEVRFQNTRAEEDPLACSSTVDLGTTGIVHGNEFVNPLQFVRNVWQRSFMRRTRPVVTSSPPFDLHDSLQQNLSDTESDLDDRDSKNIFGRKCKHNK